MTRFAWTLVFAALGCSSNEEPAAPERYTFTMDRQVIEPGSEGLTCQTFANPFGHDVDIAAWNAKLTEGAHHLIVFLVPDAQATGLEGCSVDFNSRTLVFQSQAGGATSFRYPDGVGARIPAGWGIQMHVHYLNGTTEPIEVDNAVEMELTSMPGLRPVGSLIYENLAIHVPASGVPTEVKKSCTVSRDVELIWLTSHMHSRGEHFQAALAGERIYETSEWVDPPMDPLTPMRVARTGDQVDFACTYVNDLPMDLGFGLSLETDAMCVLVGGYVASDGDADLSTPLNCRASGADCAPCIDALTSGGMPELPLCTDNGPPSSLERYEALQACTCEDPQGCAETCATSACTGAKPDDACLACTQSRCAALVDACFAE